MTLLGTIQLSSNALNVASVGLQVVGNNIANANTPDYIRQRVLQEPAPLVKEGGLLLGLGAKIVGVVQVADKFLAEQMRHATSDVASSDAQADAYTKLESAINELGDNDLSSQFTSFFGSIHDVLNQPESSSVRNIAVQKGVGLAGSIQRLDGQVRAIHQDVNNQIIATAHDLNRLLADVAQLNVQIVAAEGGRALNSDAVGLRDRRAGDLSKLAEITDIKAIEQPTGDVTVYSNGDYLVSLGTYRKVKAVTGAADGLQVSQIQIAELNSPVTAGGGRLGGLTAARDSVLGGFLGDLDQLSQTLVEQFNKVYSGGQGLTGFQQVTSERGVSIPGVPLDVAGLHFTPTSGAFQVQVANSQTGQKKTTDIQVDLNGLDADTTLNNLAGQLDAIDGITASVTADGKLQIASDSPQTTFAFAGDTSGVLASLGINTFFSGTSSATIGVSQSLKTDPSKLAISSGGVGQDTDNGARLANLLTAPLASAGTTLATLYDRLTTNVAEGSNSASAAAEGFLHFQQTLEGKNMAISGVNIDEEAVKMIEYQRGFQASARVISTLNEMLDTLLKL
jgi:flagellar hook-associated protein 1 FlgK